MVFCNKEIEALTSLLVEVTILILIDGFLQYNQSVFKNKRINVTILILIDGFLQSVYDTDTLGNQKGHNPYFNRWFSAIY